MKLVFAILLFVLNSYAKKQFNVGVLYWSMNIEGQVAMRHGLESQAALLNKSAKSSGTSTIKIIPLVAGDGEEGIKNQVQQFETLVTQRVDLIIVQPTDNAALSGALKKANKAKIPVIAYDQYIIGGKLDSFITSNNYQAGHMAGEYLAKKFKSGRKIKLVLVQYPKVSSTIDRVDRLFDALKKHKRSYEIITTYEAVEPKAGREVGQKILNSFPKKGSIDAIFTINDGGGLSVVEELVKAGRREIIHATVDGDPNSIENIKAGNLTVINSAQFCAELGRQAIIQGYDLLNKKEIPRKVLIPTFPVTKETLDRYTGWKGKIPKPFRKPWLENESWNNQIEKN